MNYYSKNAKEFIESTKDCNMQDLYSYFESFLNGAETILDIGFGSGRDSLYFANKYEVVSIDPTIEFCNYAISIGLKNIFNISAQDITFDKEFDGIWACASLLHVHSNELGDVFKKCSKALKVNGVMYCSFKYGDFEGERNGRFYIDMNDKNIEKYIKNTGLLLNDFKITMDVRPDRSEKWINFILIKDDIDF